MGAFGGVPFIPSRQTFFIGGVLFSITVGISGKPTLTITVGDNWEVLTERLTADEFGQRVSKATRAATALTNPGTIACTQGCEITAAAAFKKAYDEAVKEGRDPFPAAKVAWMQAYEDCVDNCIGGPGSIK